MFENIKAKLVFGKLLSRPDISKAYKMVGPEDSWYATISKVHESLAKIRELPHEALEIESHDGLKLRSIFYPAETKSDVTVITIHGFGSHAEREWAFPGLFYHSLGYNVLIPYQRAHGPSGGKRITFGALESLDMIDWIARVNEIAPDGKIILHGLSMGGGIALQLSAVEMKGVKCIISDAPSPSIEAFFTNVSREIFKGEGDKVAECAMKDFKKQTGLDARDFNTLEMVKEGKYPILLSAGSNEHLEELFGQIKNNNPKETDIIILDGCNHGNGMYKQTELYQSKIKEFISKNL